MFRRAWIPVILPLIVLVSVSTLASSGVRSPLVSTGTLEFSADLPVFPTATGNRLDLAVAVYHPQMRFNKAAGGGLRAQLSLELKLARQGLVAVDSTQVYTVRAEDEAAASDPTRFALLDLSVEVPPGRWAVTLGLVDLQHHVGLAEVRGKATGVLDVPSSTPGAAALSDLEFRWPGTDGSFLPNPERIYGVVHDTLDVYLELRGAEPGRSYSLAVEVADVAHDFAQRDVLSLEPGSAHAAAAYRLALGSFPEGIYQLTMSPQWDGPGPRTAEFQVAWDMAQLVQSGRDVDLEARLLLPTDEYERLRSMSRALQSQRMAEFWAQRDPSVGTERNEIFEIFLARVEYARRHFGEQGVIGPLTDRGRAYVNYGPPEEIIQEIIPLNPDELDDALLQVHDPYALELEWKGNYVREVAPKTPTIQARRERSRFVEGSSSRDAAFELWTFDMDGDRILEDGPLWPDDLNLRLLFVDRLGTGEYRLAASNHPFEG